MLGKSNKNIFQSLIRFTKRGFFGALPAASQFHRVERNICYFLLKSVHFQSFRRPANGSVTRCVMISMCQNNVSSRSLRKKLIIFEVLRLVNIRYRRPQGVRKHTVTFVSNRIRRLLEYMTPLESSQSLNFKRTVLYQLEKLETASVLLASFSQYSMSRQKRTSEYKYLELVLRFVFVLCLRNKALELLVWFFAIITKHQFIKPDSYVKQKNKSFKSSASIKCKIQSQLLM